MSVNPGNIMLGVTRLGRGGGGEVPLHFTPQKLENSLRTTFTAKRESSKRQFWFLYLWFIVDYSLFQVLN